MNSNSMFIAYSIYFLLLRTCVNFILFVTPLLWRLGYCVSMTCKKLLCHSQIWIFLIFGVHNFVSAFRQNFHVTNSGFFLFRIDASMLLIRHVVFCPLWQNNIDNVIDECENGPPMVWNNYVLFLNSAIRPTT